MLTGGPVLSVGERGRGRGEASWAAAQEGEKERARSGAGLKGQEKGEEKNFHFLFQTHFPIAFLFLQINS